MFLSRLPGGCGYQFCWVCARKYPCGSGCVAKDNVRWNVDETLASDKKKEAAAGAGAGAATAAEASEAAAAAAAAVAAAAYEDELYFNVTGLRGGLLAMQRWSMFWRCVNRRPSARSRVCCGVGEVYGGRF